MSVNFREVLARQKANLAGRKKTEPVVSRSDLEQSATGESIRRLVANMPKAEDDDTWDSLDDP